MNKGQNSTKTANGIAGNVKTSRKICSISLKTINLNIKPKRHEKLK